LKRLITCFIQFIKVAYLIKFIEIPSEQLIKSIKISILAYFPKKDFSLIENCKILLKLYQNLLKELYELNVNKTFTYSTYPLHNKMKLCIIPFNILYSSQEGYERYEEGLLNQRSYFHKILNIPIDQPHARRYKLENELNERFLSQAVMEIAKADKKDFRRIKSIHKEILRQLKRGEEKNEVLIEGDYLFYHASTERVNDKVTSILIIFKKIRHGEADTGHSKLFYHGLNLMVTQTSRFQKSMI
jgi:hypothetical protein